MKKWHYYLNCAILIVIILADASAAFSQSQKIGKPRIDVWGNLDLKEFEQNASV